MSKIRSALLGAVVVGVTAAVANPATAASPQDHKIITEEVMKTVEPIVANATNAEPWYRSRVTIGSYVAIAAQVLGPIVGHTFPPDEQALVTALIMGVCGAGGAAYALYGRWTAKKALGR